MSASNFGFLKDEFPALHESATAMERLVMVDARAACFYARRTVELLVHWIYEHDADLRWPYSRKLGALLAEPGFAAVVAPEVRTKLHYVQTLGNKAVHSHGRIRQFDALQAAKEIFHSTFWLVSKYTRFSPQVLEGVEFCEAGVVGGADASASALESSPEKLQGLEVALREKDQALAESERAKDSYEAEIANLREQIREARRRNEAVPVAHDYSEAETRDRFIDLLLEEAGWDLDFADGLLKVREFPVSGMPNTEGKGLVDYVLWGANGKPLAVVEAKKTKRDARVGQHQAKLYADCLERQFGQRPVIFYSNGYEHWVWDDARYPARQVAGFFKRDELELMIQRRGTAVSPAGVAISKAICDRYYQERTIRKITEAFEGKQRKALVVMATGAGKTRTVVALTDVLQRCNWVKRVLFLADRKALVKQATNAFKTHLPHSNPVNLIFNKEEADSRVLLSTYPTMMGLIDERREGGKRFGPGHFDLIVIDEAHRSVYQKYRAIFDYFDAMLVGLTATPREEVDKNTYSLFDLESGVPTDCYELEQAVEDNYLVPPRLVSVPIKFPRDGITYDELSDAEKEQWDLLEWDDEGNVPEQVEPAAVNQWLFNKDTVDKVLKHVIETGIKVDGGDKLGKTIIFAKNHRHAVFVQERFDLSYPHLKGSFAQVIDNQASYAQDLIDNFADPKNPPGAPQIAISVDMLDTGIDVPEVVNLVFFKTVRSRTKFWQMIGRGTRLCPDLFGAGVDKREFYVFDFLGNFEFFNAHPEGVDGNLQEPLGTRLFRRRLELIQEIRRAPAEGGPERVADAVAEDRELANAVAAQLHGEVASMNVENFIVRTKRREVETFQKRDRWTQLESADFTTLYHDVAGLPNQLPTEDPSARFFDLLMLKIQLGTLRGDATTVGLIEQVKEIARRLEELENIPAVRAELPLILELLEDEFWERVSLRQLERVRKKLRALISLVPKGSRRIVETDFEDSLGPATVISLPNLSGAVNRAEFRKKFQSFLHAHLDHIALKKIRHNEPLTKLDLTELERMLFESGEPGTREAFEASYGQQENLTLFLRKLIGLDREAAKRAFDQYLDSTTFTSRQIDFINLVIDDLTRNGVMEPSRLFEPPFTALDAAGAAGVFSEETAAQIIQIVDQFTANVSFVEAAGDAA